MRHFLVESQTANMDAVFEYNPNPKRIEKAKSALETLKQALKDDSIYNVDFVEAKTILSRSFEDSVAKYVEGISRSKYDDKVGYSEKSPHLTVYHANITSGSLNTAKAQVKKIKDFLKGIDKDFPESDKDALKKALEINEAGAALNELIKSLKEKVVKGRKPVAPDPNTFHSKMGSKEAQEVVRKKLESGIKEPLDEYEKYIKEWFESYVREIDKHDIYEVPKHHSGDPISDMVFFKCFDFVETDRTTDKSVTTYKNITRNHNAKTFPSSEAEKIRKGVEARYISKNLKKLSHVVDLKGNLTSIEPLATHKAKIGNANTVTIESGFKFKFDDGSEFTVINKIVSKYSHTGTPFEQFPTTFHDVKFPDGTKLKSPSEEKVVNEFGVAKREAP